MFLVILLPVSGQESESRTGIGMAVFLNLLPGFGLGSFMQGDRVGGTIQLTADLVGGGCSIGGTIWALGMASGAIPWSKEGSILSGVLALAGEVIFLASKVYGIAQPIEYAFDKLAEHKREEISFSFTPSITHPADRRGVSVGMELVVRYELE